MLILTDQHAPAAVTVDGLVAPVTFARHTPDAVTGPLKHPFGVVVATTDTLLIADSGNHRVVWLDTATGESLPIKADISAAGSFSGPRSVVLDQTGRLIVADTGNRRIMFSGFTLDDLLAGVADEADWTAFGVVTLPITGGVGEFAAPVGVYVADDGRTFVADPGLNRLIRFADQDLKSWVEIALPAGRRPIQPYGLAAGPDGGILVTDLVNSRVLLVAPDDSVTILIDGTTTRSIIAPVRAVLDGTDIVIADSAAAQLTRWRLDAAGNWKNEEHLLGNPGVTGGPSFPELCGLASTGDGA